MRATWACERWATGPRVMIVIAPGRGGKLEDGSRLQIVEDVWIPPRTPLKEWPILPWPT